MLPASLPAVWKERQLDICGKSLLNVTAPHPLKNEVFTLTDEENSPDVILLALMFIIRYKLLYLIIYIYTHIYLFIIFQHLSISPSCPQMSALK